MSVAYFNPAVPGTVAHKCKTQYEQIKEYYAVFNTFGTFFMHICLLYNTFAAQETNLPVLTANCSIQAIFTEAIGQFGHKVFFIEVNTWLECSKLQF